MQGRLARLAADLGTGLAVGLDEDTALVCPDLASSCRVIGTQGVRRRRRMIMMMMMMMIMMMTMMMMMKMMISWNHSQATILLTSVDQVVTE